MLEELKRKWPALEWSEECEMYGGNVLWWRYEATTGDEVHLTVIHDKQAHGKWPPVEFHSGRRGCGLEGYGKTLDEALADARRNVAELMGE